MKNLFQFIFPCFNVTVGMVALNVLQECTSLSRISLCIEVSFLNAPSQQTGYERQCIISVFLNIPFSLASLPFQLFYSESKAKYKIKFLLFVLYAMGILSFPSASKWIKSTCPFGKTSLCCQRTLKVSSSSPVLYLNSNSFHMKKDVV